MADIRRLPGTNADLWDWQLAGNCRGLPSAVFFHPEGERGPSRTRRERDAKAVCGSCPVRAQCAAHALKVHEPYGVWGGLSESERQRLIDTGWEDLADRRHRRVDLHRLDARLRGADTPESVPA